MRNYSDRNKVWKEMVKILQSKMFDRDLQMKGPMSIIVPLANMSRFFCSGENVEKLHNHLKHSKLKMKGFGIDPNSR